MSALAAISSGFVLLKKLVDYIEAQIKAYQAAEAKGWIEAATEDHEISDKGVEEQLEAIKKEVADWEKKAVNPLAEKVKSHIAGAVRAEVSKQLKHPLAIEAAERIKAEEEGG